MDMSTKTAGNYTVYRNRARVAAFALKEDMRLFAAAPALLEAAQAALTLNPDTYAIGSSQRGSDTEWDLQRKQDALRAAIAAAPQPADADDSEHDSWPPDADLVIPPQEDN